MQEIKQKIIEQCEKSKKIIRKLQYYGEGILMDLLLEDGGVGGGGGGQGETSGDGSEIQNQSANDEEENEIWQIILLLNSQKIVQIENQVGMSKRDSRSFKYRTGYALPFEVPLSSINEFVKQENFTLSCTNRRLKRLREFQKSDSGKKKKKTAIAAFIKSQILLNSSSNNNNSINSSNIPTSKEDLELWDVNNPNDVWLKEKIQQAIL